MKYNGNIADGHLHRCAVLIAARNEAAVIGSLIDSLKRQNYPADRIDIYVVADNCTDHTAEVAEAHWIRDTPQCGAADFLMPKITALGNGGAVWIVAAAAMTASKKYRKYGIAMFAALAAGVFVGNVCLKHLLARSRPCWIESVPLLIGNPTDYSFPSGHTLSSVIGAFMLTAANRKFGLLAIPLAALIGFSRLYLYVHFPSDVLASVVIGVLLGSIAVYAITKV